MPNFHKYFIDDKLTSGDGLSNSIVKSQDSIYNPEMLSFINLSCLICDKSFNKNLVFNSNCIHQVCYRCFKLFYEEKIEQGEKKLKCPFSKCKSEISNEVLIKIVSRLHFEHFLRNRANRELLTQNFFELEDIPIHPNSIARKHAIEVSHDIRDFVYLNHFNKNNCCTKCYTPNLFGKFSEQFIRCLNCLNKFCKYCLKDYSVDHLKWNSKHYCRILFSNRTDSNKKRLFRNREFLHSKKFKILSIIISIIFIYFGCISLVLNRVQETLNFKKYRLVKEICFCVLSIIIAILVFIFIMIVYPFLPALCALFG